MTRKKPFIEDECIIQIIAMLKNNVRPSRPTEDENLRRRGLDDNLWNLLTRCWAVEHKGRPTMREVLEVLPLDSRLLN